MFNRWRRTDHITTPRIREARSSIVRNSAAAVWKAGKLPSSTTEGNSRIDETVYEPHSLAE